MASIETKFGIVRVWAFMQENIAMDDQNLDKNYLVSDSICNNVKEW